MDVSRAKTNEPGGLSGTRAGSAPRAGLPGCAGCCGGVPPSRASQVFSQTSSPGVGDGGDRQTPGGSEAPGGARAPRRPRHAPQVVWRREGGARRPGPGAAGASGSHPSRPVSPAPVPSSLPTTGMTPEPEPPCARSRVGGRAATKTAATSPPGGGLRGGGHGRDGARGARTWGGRCAGGEPRGARRARGAGGRGPGAAGASRAGASGAGGLPGRAAGRPFPRGAPGGAGPACCGPPPPPPGGPEGKPGHRLAGAARAPGPEQGSGPERAGRAGPRGGDSAAGPRSPPAPIKVERPRRAARPRPGRPSAPGELAFRRTRSRDPAAGRRGRRRVETAGLGQGGRASSGGRP